MTPDGRAPTATSWQGTVISDRDHVREDFRPLTGREREILEFLLSVEIPGIEELREQVPYARAARWGCGCASFNVVIDRDAPRSTITRSPAVEAYSKERTDADKAYDLLLWVDEGWLAGVELVDFVERHGEQSPEVIPPLDYWDEPRPYKPAA